MSRVGFIGLGIMGKPMAKNLLKAGIDLMVCDLNEQAVKEVVECGAQASSYREIGEKCDIVFLILPNGSAVERPIMRRSEAFMKDGSHTGIPSGGQSRSAPA